jgi:hypothetical protein
MAVSSIEATTRDSTTLLLKSLTGRRLFFATLALASLIYFQFDIWKQPILGDRANWEYFAQVIARGGTPYRDVANIKTPLSAYIGAAAIVITHPFGVRDHYAVRAVFLLMAVLTAGFVFLTGLEYFENRATAILAALLFISFDIFPISSSAGIQPKVPMMLFGIIALWTVKKDRPYAAGVFSMLSALSWQPGLLFFGAAGLAFSRYFTNWRDKKVLKLIIGAAIPLALLLAHLWALGGLRDFYLWTIDYNINVYAPTEMKPVGTFFEYLHKMAHFYYSNETAYFYLAILGLLMAIGSEIWGGIKSGIRHLLERAPYHAVIIAPLVYLAFCSVNVQAGGDTVPFLPYVSLFAALAIVVLLDAVLNYVSRGRFAQYRQSIALAGMLLVSTTMFAKDAAGAYYYRCHSPTLQDQESDINDIVSLLGPDDRVFTQGLSEILVLSHLPNFGRHIFLDRGKDDYMIHVEEGGFEGWFARLKAARPKVVGLDRIRKVVHREDFTQWVKEEYEKRDGRAFNYYVRKDIQ